ncbi:MAG: YggT family protein [Epsilonproteobacteria bacterium]|nr:YggT family protein [Campylobacterota bacterium]
MVVFSTLLVAIANILHMVVNLYIWVVIIAALITWVQPDPYNPIVQILYRLTEPVYAMIRRFIPTNFGGFDIAPLILILGLQFFDLFFVNLLFKLASGL